MTRMAQAQGWIAGALVLTTLIAVTIASFTPTGVRFEAGGLEMRLKTSVERGLQIHFVDPD